MRCSDTSFAQEAACTWRVGRFLFGQRGWADRCLPVGFVNAKRLLRVADL